MYDIFNGAMNAYISLNVPYQSISLKLWMGMQFNFTTKNLRINLQINLKLERKKTSN
jgi:hypothetical protein